MSNEMKEINAVVISKQSGQTGPDTWDNWIVSLQVNGDTTVREIVEWATKNKSHNYFDVTLQTLEQVPAAKKELI